MKSLIISILVLLSVVIVSSCGHNQAQSVEEIKSFPVPKIDFNPRAYVCYKTNEKLNIDGNLDETSWKNVSWSQNFIDIEGELEPVYQTRVKMLWDSNYLYIAAELIEPHINAQLKQRDTVIFYDNDFEVFIDPNGDTHNYFEFEMNALNTVWDLLLTKPYREHGLVIDSWNIVGLKSAVKTYGTINNSTDVDEKWTVELAFPMSVLTEGGKSVPKDNDLWRINFSRVQWQYEVINGQYKKKKDKKTGKSLAEYNWVWSPQGLINMHYPEMWGFLQFSDSEQNSNTVKFVMPQEEMMKWELRKVYYAQKNYFAKHNKYASLVEDLQAYGYKPNKLKKIIIQTTKSDYEAIIIEDKSSWSINSAGKTFSTL